MREFKKSIEEICDKHALLNILYSDKDKIIYDYIDNQDLKKEVLPTHNWFKNTTACLIIAQHNPDYYVDDFVIPFNARNISEHVKVPSLIDYHGNHCTVNIMITEKLFVRLHEEGALGHLLENTLNDINRSKPDLFTYTTTTIQINTINKLHKILKIYAFNFDNRTKTQKEILKDVVTQFCEEHIASNKDTEPTTLLETQCKHNLDILKQSLFNINDLVGCPMSMGLGSSHFTLLPCYDNNQDMLIINDETKKNMCPYCWSTLLW